MSFAFYRVGRHRILASQPTADGYGSAVAEVLNGLYIARELDAHVAFVKPRSPLNEAIFELECGSVPVIARGTLRGRCVRCVWVATHFVPRMRDRARRTALRAARRLAREPRLPKRWRGRAKVGVGRLKSSVGPPSSGASQRELDAAVARLDFRRLYAEDPLVARLSARNCRRAELDAAAMGISADALVTLHVRESSYKRSLGLPERATDVMRNARIATYAEAVDHLIDRGYTVVRIGDPTAEPFQRAGVVDLARSPRRTEILELWCLSRSRFFIASDSGPYMAALTLGVPTLAVNVTALIGGDPLRPGDRYILKRVRDLRARRILGLDEMLTPEYLVGFRDLARYQHIDNTARDISAAVQEMTDALADPEVVEGEAQRTYRRLVEQLVRRPEVVAWRSAAGMMQPMYIGRGRICEGFARRYLHADAADAG